MILDRLEYADRYHGLGERLAIALTFLRLPTTSSLEPKAIGAEHSLKLSVRGDDIFALVQRYHTRSPQQAFWEAHRKYIDVQYVVEGSERMGHAPLDAMNISTRYDAEKDYAVLTPRQADQSLNFLHVHAGMFAIFMPHDAHMPAVSVDGPSSLVKKIVMKVRMP